MTRSDSASRLASLSNATTTAPASTSSRQTAVPMPPPPAPAIAEARDAAGPLDAVVHAFVDPAALASEPLVATAETDWDRRCEAMLRAALHCCQAAGRELSARGGRLVLVTPTIALTGAAGL